MATSFTGTFRSACELNSLGRHHPARYVDILIDLASRTARLQSLVANRKSRQFLPYPADVPCIGSPYHPHNSLPDCKPLHLSICQWRTGALGGGTRVRLTKPFSVSKSATLRAGGPNSSGKCWVITDLSKSAGKLR